MHTEQAEYAYGYHPGRRATPNLCSRPVSHLLVNERNEPNHTTRKHTGATRRRPPFPPLTVGPDGPTVREKPHPANGGSVASIPYRLTRRILTLAMAPRMTFGTKGVGGQRYWKRPCKTCAKNSNFLTTRPLAPSPQLSMGTMTIHASIVRSGAFRSVPAPGSGDPADMTLQSKRHIASV